MNSVSFEFIYALTRQYDNIARRKTLLVQPERFANDTLNTVTIHRKTHIFFRNNETNPSVAGLIWAGEYQ